MTGGMTRNDGGGDIRNFSTNVLKAILSEDLNSDPAERLSPEIIKQIISVIRAREEAEGKHEPVDIAAAWEKIKAVSLSQTDSEGELVDSPSKAEVREPSRRPTYLRHKTLKRLIVAAAIIAGLLFGALVAQAAGIDVFGIVGRWTSETFHFSYVGEGANPIESDSTLQNDSDAGPYALLKNALSDCGISEENAPTWCPKGFVSAEPHITNSDFGHKVYCLFEDREGQFTVIDIRDYATAADLNYYAFEKDDSFVEKYVNGARTFYILSNENELTATWASPNIVITITGSISLDDLKTIIDSIGGK